MTNEEAFLVVARLVDWTQQPPEIYRESILASLAAGAHGMARWLAIEGHRLHPTDDYLTKADYVMNPGKSTKEA